MKIEEEVKSLIRDRKARSEGDYVEITILKDNKYEVFRDRYLSLDEVFSLIEQRDLKYSGGCDKEIYVVSNEEEEFTIQFNFPCFGEERIEDFFYEEGIGLAPFKEMKSYGSHSVFVYHWKRTDGNPVKEEHIEALDKDAKDRIVEMVTEGYVEGDLSTTVRMDDEDGEDGIYYVGYWSLPDKDCEE